MKTRLYNVDPGYVTITEASEIVSQLLRLTDKESNTYKIKIREDAKKGLFGGKKYKKRMYQVKRADIIQYAQDIKRQEQVEIDIDIAPNSERVHISSKLPHIPIKKTILIIVGLLILLKFVGVRHCRKTFG
ncbi:hypothetical protein NC661_05955 [Aquibacillus koreensis]|uniref:Uncharacterized protein n=1 Tax=Aquibacillus koreensis TaxID=279446 RepID=A0A9X3WMD1_9BACI|nr:hypothetical protein [Aquibacillus koreensis]MCT2537106.1 hypothetical protein [Aquibacillus koreensis]MDC3419911.1 hypothetical protein [Aquibacillus koreensis]